MKEKERICRRARQIVNIDRGFSFAYGLGEVILKLYPLVEVDSCIEGSKTILSINEKAYLTVDFNQREDRVISIRPNGRELNFLSRGDVKGMLINAPLY